MEIYAGEKPRASTARCMADGETLSILSDYVVSIKGVHDTVAAVSAPERGVSPELGLYVCLPRAWFRRPSPVKEPQKNDMVIFRENGGTSTRASSTSGNREGEEADRLLQASSASQDPLSRDSGSASSRCRVKNRTAGAQAIQYAIDNASPRSRWGTRATHEVHRRGVRDWATRWRSASSARTDRGGPGSRSKTEDRRADRRQDMIADAFLQQTAAASRYSVIAS